MAILRQEIAHIANVVLLVSHMVPYGLSMHAVCHRKIDKKMIRTTVIRYNIQYTNQFIGNIVGWIDVYRIKRSSAPHIVLDLRIY